MGLFRTSGLLYADTFNRADGSPGTPWVSDLGTWRIVSNKLTLQTAAYTGSPEFAPDRLRNTAINSNRMVAEFVMAVAGGQQAGPLLLGQSGQNGEGYEMLITPGVGLQQTAHNTPVVGGVRQTPTTWFGSQLPVTGDQEYRYKVSMDASGSTLLVNNRTEWLVQDLVNAGANSPHDAIVGPTAAGAGGFVAYGGTSFTIDEVYFYKSIYLTVSGLTGTQGFRLYDATNAVIGSSAAQSGGSATLNIATLINCPFTGYIQVFDDAGTWAAPTTDGRAPASGSYTNIYGGDVWAFGSGRPSLIVQVNWSNTGTFPDKWTSTHHDVSADLCRELEVQRTAVAPDPGEDRCTFWLDDPDNKYVPAHSDSPIGAQVLIGREVRVLAAFGGITVAKFYGMLDAIEPDHAFPHYQTRFTAKSPLAAILAVEVGPFYLPDAIIYDPADLPHSALAMVFAAAAQAGYSVPSVLWDFDTDLTEIKTDPRDIEITAIDDTSGGAAIALNQRVWGPRRTIGEHLRDLSRQSGGMAWIEPVYRESTGQPDYRVRWQARDTKLNAGDDDAWALASGDFNDLSSRRRTEALQ